MQSKDQFKDQLIIIKDQLVLQSKDKLSTNIIFSKNLSVFRNSPLGAIKVVLHAIFMIRFV